MINTDVQLIIQVLIGDKLMNPGLPEITMENSDSSGVLNLVGESFEIDASASEVPLNITAHSNASAIFIFDQAGGDPTALSVKVNGDNEARAAKPFRFLSGESLTELLVSNALGTKQRLFVLSVVPTDEIAFSSTVISTGTLQSINDLSNVNLGTLSSKQGYFLRINNGVVEALNFIGDIEETNQVANYDFTDDDFLIPFDCTSGNLLGNIPTAVGRKNKIFAAKKMDASDNYVQVTPDGSETIDGDAFVRLRNKGQTILIQSNGVNWIGIAEYRA